MIIIQKCNRCGAKNRYEKGEYKGREFTNCKECRQPLTICNGYVLGSMDKKEYKQFMKICGI